MGRGAGAACGIRCARTPPPYRYALVGGRGCGCPAGVAALAAPEVRSARIGCDRRGIAARGPTSVLATCCRSARGRHRGHHGLLDAAAWSVGIHHGQCKRRRVRGIRPPHRPQRRTAICMVRRSDARVVATGPGLDHCLRGVGRAHPRCRWPPPAGLLRRGVRAVPARVHGRPLLVGRFAARPRDTHIVARAHHAAGGRACIGARSGGMEHYGCACGGLTPCWCGVGVCLRAGHLLQQPRRSETAHSAGREGPRYHVVVAAHHGERYVDLGEPDGRHAGDGARCRSGVRVVTAVVHPARHPHVGAPQHLPRRHACHCPRRPAGGTGRCPRATRGAGPGARSCVEALGFRGMAPRRRPPTSVHRR